MAATQPEEMRVERAHGFFKNYKWSNNICNSDIHPIRRMAEK